MVPFVRKMNIPQVIHVGKKRNLRFDVKDKNEVRFFVQKTEESFFFAPLRPSPHQKPPALRQSQAAIRTHTTALHHQTDDNSPPLQQQGIQGFSYRAEVQRHRFGPTSLCGAGSAPRGFAQRQNVSTEQLGGVILGVHLADGINDDALLVDDVGGADGAHRLLAVHLLHTPGLVGLKDGRLGVGD